MRADNSLTFSPRRYIRQRLESIQRTGARSRSGGSGGSGGDDVMESGGDDGGSGGYGYEGSDSGGSGRVSRGSGGLGGASDRPLQPDPQQQTQQMLQQILQELQQVRERLDTVEVRQRQSPPPEAQSTERSALLPTMEARTMQDRTVRHAAGCGVNVDSRLLLHMQELSGRVQHGWWLLVGMLLPPSPPSPASSPLQPPPPPPKSEPELENSQQLN